MKLKPVRGALTRHYVHDNQIRAAIAAVLLVVASAAVIAMAPTIRDRSGSASIARRLPDGIAALLGIEPGLSLDSAAGYLDAWMLSLALPLVLAAVALPIAVRSIAGSESTGEMEWLAAQPLQRGQIVVERFLAIVILTAQAALPAAIVLAVGASVGELELGFGTVVWAVARVVILVLLLAAIVLIASAASGSLEFAIFVAAAVPLIVFGLIVGGESTARLSPVRWVLGATPADAGPAGVGVLAALGVTAICVAAAVLGFRRRDIVL